MRRGVVAVVVALLLFASAAGAWSRGHTRQVPARTARLSPAHADALASALISLKTNMENAIELEDYALTLMGRGDDKGAVDQIERSKKYLDDAIGPVEELKPPSLLRSAVPDDPWNDASSDLEDAIDSDSVAVKRYREEGVSPQAFVLHALPLKRKLYGLAKSELDHAKCTELVNLQGPIMVNGVPQGAPMLEIDFSCSEPIRRIYVVFPTLQVTQAAPEGSATDRLLNGGKVLELNTDDAKSGGVTVETNPPAAAPDPFDSGIVPIAGDSVVYMPEVM